MATPEESKWQDFGSKFKELADLEQQLTEEIARATGRKDDLCVYAYCGGFYEHPDVPRERQHPGRSQWRIGGGANDSFRERVRNLIVRAGIALGAPKDTDPEDFWLGRLYLDLRDKSTKVARGLYVDDGGDRHDLEFPEQKQIAQVCKESETFCSRLDTQALGAPKEQPGKQSKTDLEFPDAAGQTTEVAPQSWQEIEIAFLSDERVEICGGGKRETYNYGELGFEDHRSGKPNRAWVTLYGMAGQGGTIPVQPQTVGRDLAKIQKRIEEIREKLRGHFGIQADPIPFNSNTYQASFKISCRPSCDT